MERGWTDPPFELRPRVASMLQLSLVAAIFCWIATRVTAASPELLKRINTASTAGSSPRLLAAGDERFYFSSRRTVFDPIHIWTSDGSPEGARLLWTLRGFPDSRSTPIIESSASIGDTLFLLVRHDVIEGDVVLPGALRLWRSDGTPDESVILFEYDNRDFRLGFSAEELRTVGSTLFFVAPVEGGGLELWKTDGTLAGTTPVKGTHASPDGSGPKEMSVFGRGLIFSAEDEENGREPWISDGTPGGTARIRDINPVGSATPTGFVQVDQTVFFTADDGTYGRELWKTDGTEAGTVIVRDILPGPQGSNPRDLAAVNGVLFFAADGGDLGFELWTSEGAAATTRMVKDIAPGASSSRPLGFTALGDLVLFSAEGVGGRELWRSDGTEIGTSRVIDIFHGSQSSSPWPLGLFGGELFFAAGDEAHGRELWRTDGTSEGTTLIKDIWDGSDGSIRITAVVWRGELYFEANDGVSGRELWKSDGTRTGTVLVEDLNRTPTGSRPEAFVQVGGTLFFTADDSVTGRELWKSDGTEAGTQRVKDTTPGQNIRGPEGLVEVNGALFFAANDSLWRSDGTEVGTVVLQSFTRAATLSQLTDVGGVLFFTSDADEIWASDGTLEGTRVVKDLRGPGEFAVPRHLTNVDGELFFVAGDGFPAAALWKSDGTETGTVMVAEIRGTPGAELKRLTPVDERVFFVVDRFDSQGIWVSDGTAAGTKELAVIDSLSYQPSAAAMNGTFFLGTGAGVLWKSEGTVETTEVVRDFGARGERLDPIAPLADFTAFEGELFLLVFGEPANELWKSDGTTEGTVLVTAKWPSDFHPFFGVSPSVQALTVVDERLFFAAKNSERVWRLWTSDGTDAGTRLVGDPDAEGAAAPRLLTPYRGSLVFSARDEMGTEPWILRPSSFVRGDANADGQVDVSDVTFILDYLFSGGAAPPCRDAADADDDGVLLISDPIFLLSALFLGGPGVPAPEGGCGVDSTEDGLGCGRYAPCE